MRSMDPGSTLPILSPLGSMFDDSWGFGCFCWLAFWAPFETLFLGILGNNAEASLRNFFWLGRCPQGFLGNISGTFRGYFWEIFLGMFEHWAIFCETSLGIFWVNIPGGIFEGNFLGDFLRTWLGLNFPWNLWPPKYPNHLKKSIFILPYLSIRPWKFPRLKVHFRAELRPENFAQLSEIQEFFLHSAGAKLWLLYAAVQNAARFFDNFKHTVLSWVPAGSATRFFHGGQSHRSMRLPYSNSLCIHANNCPKGDQRTITNPFAREHKMRFLGRYPQLDSE